VIQVPPHAVQLLCREQNLVTLFRENGLFDGETGFALRHLSDHLQSCCMFVNNRTIEFTPAFLPSQRIDFLTDPTTRRVYLSATMTSEVDFCRAFGKRPTMRIEPESDAGIGERLIILIPSSRLKSAENGTTSVRLASLLSQKQKLLIVTSSYLGAQKYAPIAVPPQTATFSAALEAFRRSAGPGAFVLVGRVDGIDLPHATCRVMLADGLPTGFSLYEIYLYDSLGMRNSFAAKLANRVTQMFGRTNRGRNDYSVIFSVDPQFVAWLSTPRNVALLPSLLRKQLLLGASLVEQFQINSIEALPDLVDRVVNRDPDWLSYYQDSIAGREIGEDQLGQAAEKR
jgi:hypothetical protein